jgi:hypothetical protein
MVYYVDIGPNIFYPIFFLISDRWFLKYRVLNSYPHWGKKDTSTRFPHNNSFENALRETYRAHYKCIFILYVNIPHHL